MMKRNFQTLFELLIFISIIKSLECKLNFSTFFNKIICSIIISGLNFHSLFFLFFFSLGKKKAYDFVFQDMDDAIAEKVPLLKFSVQWDRKNIDGAFKCGASTQISASSTIKMIREIEQKGDVTRNITVLSGAHGLDTGNNWVKYRENQTIAIHLELLKFNFLLC